MRLFVCLGIALLGIGCSRSNEAERPSSTWKYQIEEDRYAVVMVQEQDQTKDDARKLLQLKAAELTQEQGYRYYVIQKEEEVKILEDSRESKGIRLTLFLYKNRPSGTSFDTFQIVAE